MFYVSLTVTAKQKTCNIQRKENQSILLQKKKKTSFHKGRQQEREKGKKETQTKAINKMTLVVLTYRKLLNVSRLNYSLKKHRVIR